jgi:hypothetical protein
LQTAGSTQFTFGSSDVLLTPASPLYHANDTGQHQNLVVAQIPNVHLAVTGSPFDLA